MSKVRDEGKFNTKNEGILGTDYPEALVHGGLVNNLKAWCRRSSSSAADATCWGAEAAAYAAVEQNPLRHKMTRGVVVARGWMAREAVGNPVARGYCRDVARGFGTRC